ncbi:hypothetical protein GCM10009609_50080 [Pseudonocardia aurantiaca]|uniref:Galactose mutarotase-like enzyme n=1 Tax=Pseudonocardia aurantiaca TaxID=75290 RepID=A0ABW4FQW3_9PSEU
MPWPPSDPAWRRLPLTVTTDLAHGGRWTSLRTSGREWLWRHPDDAVAAARALVRPGNAFIDAGGVEECFPTLRGEPDHGDAWSRPWTEADGGQRVRLGELHLTRRFQPGAGVGVDYSVTGPPGTPVVHAVHALLDVSPAARLHAPGVGAAHVLDDPVEGAIAQVPWPSGALDRLGPDDGTATAVVLPGCARAAVVDGADALVMSWRVTAAGAGTTTALLLWRNLGGWPAGAPYRSIGVEPMAGSAADLAAPAPGRPATTDASGVLRWGLTLTAWRQA